MAVHKTPRDFEKAIYKTIYGDDGVVQERTERFIDSIEKQLKTDIESKHKSRYTIEKKIKKFSAKTQVELTASDQDLARELEYNGAPVWRPIVAFVESVQKTMKTAENRFRNR